MKNYFLKLPVIIYFLINISNIGFYSCSTKSNESSKKNTGEPGSINTSGLNRDVQSMSKKDLQDSSLFKNFQLRYKDHSINVEVYYMHDNVDLKDDYIDNVVLKQEIYFKYRDSTLKSIDFPVKKIDVKTKTGKKLVIQENNIYRLSVVEGEKGWFYKISGGGILATQSEFYGAYSPDGKLLWYSYATFRNTNGKYKDDPQQGYGDLNKLLQEYQIPEFSFNKPEKFITVIL